MSIESKTEKRLLKELQKIQESPLSIANNVGPVKQDNLLEWQATLLGPVGSPYEGGKFKLDIKFPDTYPIKPPKINFITSVYHPSVSMAEGGVICQDVMERDWSPMLKIGDVLNILHTMLLKPEGASPLDPAIGEVLVTDPKRFQSNAKKHTAKYAS